MVFTQKSWDFNSNIFKRNTHEMFSKKISQNLVFKLLLPKKKKKDFLKTHTLFFKPFSQKSWNFSKVKPSFLKIKK